VIYRFTPESSRVFTAYVAFARDLPQKQPHFPEFLPMQTVLVNLTGHPPFFAADTTRIR
jgi:hypothetical protein